MKNDQLTDFVKRFRRGDRDAFTGIYSLTYSSVYWQIFYMVKDEKQAEDLAQETFIKAYCHMESLESPESFPVWLKRIAARTAIDWMRSTSSGEIPASEAEPSEYREALLESSFEEEKNYPSPEAAYDRKESQQLIRQIIDTLTENQRTAILLFYYGDMKIREIADVMDVSESTVKSFLHYGRSNIKKRVLELEKKGVVLYSLAPFTFFVWLLRSEANRASAAVTAGTGAAAIAAAGSAAAGGSSAGAIGTAAAGGAAAGAAGAGAAGTVAGGTTAAGAAGAGAGTGLKIGIIGVIAAAVIGGGAVGYQVTHRNVPDTQGFVKESPGITGSQELNSAEIEEGRSSISAEASIITMESLSGQEKNTSSPTSTELPQFTEQEPTEEQIDMMQRLLNYAGAWDKTQNIEAAFLPAKNLAVIFQEYCSRAENLGDIRVEGYQDAYRTGKTVSAADADAILAELFDTLDPATVDHALDHFELLNGRYFIEDMEHGDNLEILYEITDYFVDSDGVLSASGDVYVYTANGQMDSEVDFTAFFTVDDPDAPMPFRFQHLNVSEEKTREELSRPAGSHGFFRVAPDSHPTLLSEPKTGADALQELSQNDVVTVLEFGHNGFWKAEFQGTTGYILPSFLIPTLGAEEPDYIQTETVKDVIMRDTPDENDSRAATLPAGTQIRYYEKSENGFCLVGVFEFESGMRGYISERELGF